MTRRADAIASTMTLLAGAVAASVVLGIPALWFGAGYRGAAAALDTQAEVNARDAGRLVVANPRMWIYEQARLAELLERRAASGEAEARRILDLAGKVVAESADPLPPPTLQRRRPIYDAGVAVAQVEVARSLRPLLLETGLALAGALLAAALAFAALRTIPLRAVRHAYAALEESEARYRTLYGSMAEGLALHGVVRDRGGAAVGFSVLDVNPAFSRMLGGDAGALVGADGASLLGGALAPHVPDLLRVAETQEPHAFELTVAEPARTLHVSAFSPRRDRVATLVEDVTDRRQAEAARRQLQEHLAHAQRLESVGRLAGGVAHDFNNILTVILSYARALTEELRGEQRDHAEEIARAGQRGAALTRQLLTFSRKQVLSPEVLRVEDVLASFSRMIGRLLGDDVRLSMEVAPGVGRVRMDPAQLEQALVNLAVNARDAMPGGGQLLIRAGDAELGPAEAERAGLPAGPYVAISVTDTGTGMDAATLSRVFEPFFTTKPKGKGTGLGLAMVLGAVEQGGGRVGVASAPGAGTTFTLHLPRVPGEAARATPAPARAGAVPGGHGERVLLVDDEPQLRAAVRLFLTGGGYQVIEAASGDEGLAAFRASGDAIDLVLTDLVMPGTSGVALGRAVAELRPVPVLYMSGYSEEVASGQEALPPERFLQKPFEREVLLERVHRALAAHRDAAMGRAS
ncbi:ATP-binding protein [Anaeromyxobacter diazotrophicus]|uniref:histidine kinase n=1 Tax=Anaeromyxobacter diazotrophicus TaxID=2590199 RepID=A0A7I9VHA1_9BACT|nr:ATP-binding protein [Anaeromyxobacter diazotrophicus]GEJ55771.1 hypothetical protein AMYX_05120 [Anaeromyxobacter diazotrophicus]